MTARTNIPSCLVRFLRKTPPKELPVYARDMKWNAGKDPSMNAVISSGNIKAELWWYESDSVDEHVASIDSDSLVAKAIIEKRVVSDTTSSLNINGNYSIYGGTSLSAPIISGMFSLINLVRINNEFKRDVTSTYNKQYNE